MSQQVILTFERFKYLKLSALLSALSILLYIFHEPVVKPNGGTWLGYTLGTIGALLIVWLLMFGIRKRSYRSNLGTVRGWLSAHVYLGVALALVATLHAGFEFGWNIHTLAYVLTLTVIISGIWGVVVYARNPTLMSDMLGGRTLQQLGQTLREIDGACRAASESAPADVKQWVVRVSEAPIFNSRWQRYTGRNPDCLTQQAVEVLAKRPMENQKALMEMQTRLLKRAQQLGRIREFVRLRSWVQVWLMVHVPLSFALLASLIAHIVSVFIYW